MMSRTLLFTCLLGLAVLATADRPRTCPSGCPFMQEGKYEGKRPPVLKCRPCSPGYYTAAVGACCTECKDGIITIDSATSTAKCTPCPKGSEPKKSSSGAITCMCKSGSQANGTDPVTGVSGCTKCAAGTFNPNKTQAVDACQACPTGLVSGPGAEKCFACPAPNTTALADQTGCECSSNYFVAPAPPKPSPRPRKWRSFGEDKDSKDGVKIPLCQQCADPTANGAPNMWPTCCAAGSSWDGTACVALCPSGADYVNGVCTCAGGADFDTTLQECVCANGATWDAVTKECMCGAGGSWNATSKTCSCANGANWDATLEVPACVCPAGAAPWDGTTCCPLATWGGSACTCGDETISGATWNTGTFICECASATDAWDSTSQTCLPVP